MIDPAGLPATAIEWGGAVRIIRSLHPPIDLFEDIADPADWSLLASAEQKTNPRLMETIGNLDLVPADRRVGGPDASYLMAPFTHASPDRPSRFSGGRFGVLYVGDRFEVALMETIHHHAKFMAATDECPGWTSQFREILLDVKARLHDLRGSDPSCAPVLHPDDYGPGQVLGHALRSTGSDGLIYTSVHQPDGECAALFYPDLASNIRQGRHLDYHWSGQRVDYIRDATTGQTYYVVADETQGRAT